MRTTAAGVAESYVETVSLGRSDTLGRLKTEFFRLICYVFSLGRHYLAPAPTDARRRPLMDNEPPDSAAADPSMPSMYLSLGDHVSTGVSDIGIAMPTLGSKGEMMLLSPRDNLNEQLLRDLTLQTTAISRNSQRIKILAQINQLQKFLNDLASISMLPEELLVEILLLAVVDDRKSTDGLTIVSARRALELAGVCSRWWAIVTKRAAFWTGILNSCPTRKFALRHSQAAPLDLHYLGHESQHVDAFFADLSNERPRWRSIEVDISRFNNARSLVDDWDGDEDPNVVSNNGLVPTASASAILDSNTLSDLWGQNLELLNISYPFDYRNPVSVQLSFVDCPLLKTLIAHGISIGTPLRAIPAITNLTKLSVMRFVQTTELWYLILALIGASPALEELQVVPMSGGGLLDRPTAELDNGEDRSLRLMELYELELDDLPPWILSFFVRHATFSCTKLARMCISIKDPDNQTLELLSNPNLCSVSQAIRRFSSSEPNAYITATVGSTSSTVIYEIGGSQPAWPVRLTIVAPAALTMVMRRLSSMFNHSEGPLLHITLCGMNSATFSREMLTTLFDATPSAVTLQLCDCHKCRFQPSAIGTMMLLKELLDELGPNEALCTWPQLNTILLPDLSVVKKHHQLRQILLDITANRTRRFQHEECQAVVRVQDEWDRVLDESGDVMTKQGIRFSPSF